MYPKVQTKEKSSSRSGTQGSSRASESPSDPSRGSSPRGRLSGSPEPLPNMPDDDPNKKNRQKTGTAKPQPTSSTEDEATEKMSSRRPSPTYDQSEQPRASQNITQEESGRLSPRGASPVSQVPRTSQNVPTGENERSSPRRQSPMDEPRLSQQPRISPTVSVEESERRTSRRPSARSDEPRASQQARISPTVSVGEGAKRQNPISDESQPPRMSPTMSAGETERKSSRKPSPVNDQSQQPITSQTLSSGEDERQSSRRPGPMNDELRASQQPRLSPTMSAGESEKKSSRKPSPVNDQSRQSKMSRTMSSGEDDRKTSRSSSKWAAGSKPNTSDELPSDNSSKRRSKQKMSRSSADTISNDRKASKRQSVAWRAEEDDRRAKADERRQSKRRSESAKRASRRSTSKGDKIDDRKSSRRQTDQQLNQNRSGSGAAKADDRRWSKRQNEPPQTNRRSDDGDAKSNERRSSKPPPVILSRFDKQDPSNVRRKEVEIVRCQKTIKPFTPGSDALNSEFLYYTVTLREVLPLMEKRRDRKRATAWLEKLSSPAYQTVPLREKRNKYMLRLCLNVLNNETTGMFSTLPTEGVLPTADEPVEHIPVARWERDDFWNFMLRDIDYILNEPVPCSVHATCGENQDENGVQPVIGDLLDHEFRFFLYLARPFTLLLQRAFEKARLTVWLQTLAKIRTTACLAMKGIRNDYMQALLGYLQELRMTGPFQDFPPLLKPLPPLAELSKHYPTARIIDPKSREVDDFLRAQPTLDNGAFCYMAVTGELDQIVTTSPFSS